MITIVVVFLTSFHVQEIVGRATSDEYEIPLSVEQASFLVEKYFDKLDSGIFVSAAETMEISSTQVIFFLRSNDHPQYPNVLVAVAEVDLASGTAIVEDAGFHIGTDVEFIDLMALVTQRDLGREEGFTTIPMISAGTTHTVALHSNGLVLAWGNNYRYGQLGDGTSTNSYGPTYVYGLANIVSITSGAFHSLALRNDNTVWAWGNNRGGQLGDGTIYERNIPIQVADLYDVIDIAAGVDISFALQSDGTVWAWGRLDPSQPGDNTVRSPVQIHGLNNITSIVAGMSHLLALQSDGTVWAWGGNLHGQLGDGTTTGSRTPVRVRYLDNIIALAAHGSSSFALQDGGTAWSWGYNMHGQLGDGSTAHRNIPVQINGMIGVSALFPGFLVKDDESVWGWGGNWVGQVGDGTISNHYTPIRIESLIDVLEIARGPFHSVALKNDGTVWAWGQNHYGRVGDNTAVDRKIPVQVIEADGVGYLNLNTSAYIQYLPEQQPPRGEPAEYHIIATASRPTPRVNVGRTFQLDFYLYRNGQPVQDWEPSFSISDNSIVSLENHESGPCGINFIDARGLSVGESYITILDSASGAEVTISIAVVKLIENHRSYWIDNIPRFYPTMRVDNHILTNFYDVNGLFINNFEHERSQENPDYYSVRFDVFNSRFMHGAVDIYDKDGLWIESYRIDKFTNISSIWDTGRSFVNLIRDARRGNILSYVADNYSQRTRIDIMVPKGGYFTISNNFSASPGTFMYNGIDFVLLGASTMLERVIGSSATDEIAADLVRKAIEATDFHTLFIEQFASISSDLSRTSMGNGNVAGVIADNLENLLLQVEIDWRDATKLGIGLGEAYFAKLAGPAGPVLKTLFTGNRMANYYLQELQIRNSVNAPVIAIHTPDPRGSFTAQGVTAIPSVNAISSDAVLHVFRVVSYDPILDWYLLGYRYELFNISFVRNGDEKIRTNGPITVMIPIPTDFDRNNVRVHHDSGDGVWRALDARVEGNHIVFETENFSLFAVVETSSPENNLTIILIVSGTVALLILTGIILVVANAKRKAKKRAVRREGVGRKCICGRIVGVSARFCGKCGRAVK